MKVTKLLALLSALTIVGTIVPMSASADDTGITLDTGYEFVDSAYSPTLGYMVAAKDYTKASSGNPLPVVLYNSKDGLTWTKVHSDSTAYNNVNKYSRQQLDWWDNAGMFVLSTGSTIKTSTNGTTWTARNGAARGNAMIATSGDELTVVGGRAAKLVTPSNYTADIDYHIFDTATDKTYVNAVGVSTKKNDARSYLFITNGYYYQTDGAYDASTSNASFTNVRKSFGFNTGAPLDVVFDESNDAWFMINGSKYLYKYTTAGENSNFPSAGADALITAVGADDDVLVIGTADGKLYYTSTATAITSTSAWTEIAGTGLSDEVRTISSSKDGNFIVASKSSIYKITKKDANYSYDVFKETVEEKFECGQVTISGPASANAFDGVKLIGGTYSSDLGKYIVYGNTTTPTAGDYGRIYSSTDGITWSVALKSAVKFNEKSSTGAVWWDKAIADDAGNVHGAFIVSCSTNDSGDGKVVGTGWFSKDGNNWSYTSELKLCADGDIVVHNGCLYTPSDGAYIRKISTMTSAGVPTIEQVEFTKPSTSFSARRLAISTDGNIMLIGPDSGTPIAWNIANGTSTSIGTNSSFAITEMAYDDSFGHFVMTTSGESGFYGIDGNTRKFTFRPYEASGTKYITFAKVGTNYVFGQVDGGIIYADASTISAKAQDYTKVEPANSANTKKIFDIFAGAGNKAVAVAYDSTAKISDAILVDTEAKTYKCANDYIKATASAGDTLSISMNYTNTTSDDITANLIRILYTEDGVFIGSQATGQTLVAGESGTISDSMVVADDAPENLSINVMLWDNNLIPLTDTLTPYLR